MNAARQLVPINEAHISSWLWDPCFKALDAVQKWNMQ